MTAPRCTSLSVLAHCTLLTHCFLIIHYYYALATNNNASARCAHLVLPPCGQSLSTPLSCSFPPILVRTPRYTPSIPYKKALARRPIPPKPQATHHQQLTFAPRNKPASRNPPWSPSRAPSCCCASPPSSSRRCAPRRRAPMRAAAAGGGGLACVAAAAPARPRFPFSRPWSPAPRSSTPWSPTPVTPNFAPLTEPAPICVIVCLARHFARSSSPMACRAPPLRVMTCRRRGMSAMPFASRVRTCSVAGAFRSFLRFSVR